MYSTALNPIGYSPKGSPQYRVHIYPRPGSRFARSATKCSLRAPILATTDDEAMQQSEIVAAMAYPVDGPWTAYITRDMKPVMHHTFEVTR